MAAVGVTKKTKALKESWQGEVRVGRAGVTRNAREARSSRRCWLRMSPSRLPRARKKNETELVRCGRARQERTPCVVRAVERTLVAVSPDLIFRFRRHELRCVVSHSSPARAPLHAAGIPLYRRGAHCSLTVSKGTQAWVALRQV